MGDLFKSNLAGKPDKYILLYDYLCLCSSFVLLYSLSSVEAFFNSLVHTKTREVHKHLRLTSAMLLLSSLEKKIQRKPSAEVIVVW